MAGNTKLVGFGPRLPDKPGTVQLSRWGGQVIVAVSDQSLENLREACYKDLPQRPVQGSRDDLDGFHVQYDESVGRVHVGMDTGTAEVLAAILETSIDHPDILFGREERGNWIHSLKDAVQAHLDYHNREGEPGINENPS